jgi:hypothetical protein
VVPLADATDRRTPVTLVPTSTKAVKSRAATRRKGSPILDRQVGWRPFYQLVSGSRQQVTGFSPM